MPWLKDEAMPAFLAALQSQGRLWVPVEEEWGSCLAVWEEKSLRLTPGPTLLAAKGLFLPQTEKLFHYRVEAEGAVISESEPPAAAARQIVFGLRPCDVAAVAVMDKVFLDGGYVDCAYRARREASALVALACREAAPTCFCRAFGLDPLAAPGADVLLLPLEGGYLVRAQTAKGEELLAQAQGVLAQEPALDRPAPPEFLLEVTAAGAPAKLAAMFDHPLWNNLYQKCLGCGICTYLCPTCYCFDVQSADRGTEGYRYRCWDSCMFPEYTLMAGGHNPRPTKKERVRNRFLHKLCYLPERFGVFGCVGCGRCLLKCPVNLDIAAVLKKVQEVGTHV